MIQQAVATPARVAMRGIAEQLGAKLGPEQSEELVVGGSLHASLADPSRLARLGVTGVHEGARITAMRTAPNRLRLEVDELEPAPVTRKALLRIDEGGRLVAEDR